MSNEPVFPRELMRPLSDLRTLDEYLQHEAVHVYPRPTTIRILFLCEGLQFDSSSGFSFKAVIDILRNDAAVKYANFRLTLASWAANSANPVQKDSTPGSYGATYTNYRFSSLDPDDGKLILDKFDEVWLFGISPNMDQPQQATNILASGVCPTPTDIEKLTRWMNAGGGVLAMGDHASLGAHLCARVPRVWTMRRWSSDDGAPPRVGNPRVDTNQPMSVAQDPDVTTSPSVIPFDAQSDEIAQTIEVRRFRTSFGFHKVTRPHPILCGGKLGTIDVLPDHPHEGWVNEDADIDLSADILLSSPPADLDAREYPSIGGVQPKPQVIAWGNTPPAPPHQQEKGPSDAKRFGVIGAYDGQLAGLGRVVVDSTWHHWMSVNLAGEYVDDDPSLPGDQPLVGLREANNTAYKKIQTYFRNVAVWLAPKAKQERMLAYVAFWAAHSTYTFEDWRPSTPYYILGLEAKEVLSKSVSACFLSRWVLELIPERYRPIIPELEWRDPKDPFGPICLTCPDIEHLEALALGVLLSGMMRLRDDLRATAAELDPQSAEGFEKKLMATLQGARKEASAMIGARLRKELDLRAQLDSKR